MSKWNLKVLQVQKEQETQLNCVHIFFRLPLGDADKLWIARGLKEARVSIVCWMLLGQGPVMGVGWRLSMLVWAQPPCQSKQTKPLLIFPKGPRAPGKLLSVWWEEVLSNVRVGTEKEMKEILPGSFFDFTCLWDKGNIVASGLGRDYARIWKTCRLWSYTNCLHYILIHEIKSWIQCFLPR